MEYRTESDAAGGRAGMRIDGRREEEEDEREGRPQGSPDAAPLREVNVGIMTGAGFEDLCKDLLEANGFGRVEKRGGSGDGGIDLLAHGRRGLIAVECKYRREGGAVGREVVQKLHSAAQAEGASSAMIMATGGFSADAKRYARLDIRDMRMSLVSLEDLSRLAERAGKRLVMDPGGTAGQVARFHPLADAEARDALARHLSRLQSHPLTAAEIASTASHAVELKPYYLATASLQKGFPGGTQTVHRIDVADERILINAETGRPAGPEALKFYGKARIYEAGELEPGAQGGGRFVIGADAARNAAADHMAKRHARTVRYKGKNNVRYSKRCEAGRGDVDVGDVRPVAAERHVFEMRILGRQYKAWVEYNGEVTRTGGSGMGVCSACGKRIRGGSGGLLCNDCGAVVHAAGRWPGRGHGHACGRCGRTVCSGCAYSERKWGVLKTPLCRGCAGDGRPQPEPDRSPPASFS